MNEYVLFTSQISGQRPTDSYSKDSGDDAEIVLVNVLGRTRVHIWLPKLPEHEISLWLDEIISLNHLHESEQAVFRNAKFLQDTIAGLEDVAAGRVKTATPISEIIETKTHTKDSS